MKTYCDRIDLTGKKIGMLTIIGEADEYIDAHSAWICKCNCGNTKIICSKDLIRSNPTRSCGCLYKRTSKYHLEIGQKFNRWTIIEPMTSSHEWKCKCNCGNIGIVKSSALVREMSKSCGCLTKELSRQRSIFQPGTVFGKLTIISVISHDKFECKCVCGDTRDLYRESIIRGTFKGCKCNPKISTHPLHGMFYSMMSRCHRPHDRNYINYGARGIRVYDEWRDNPAKFFQWMDDNLGPKPSHQYSLDRIDNNKGYEPGNLKWATPQEQNLNRRNSIVARTTENRRKQSLLSCLAALYEPQKLKFK